MNYLIGEALYGQKEGEQEKKTGLDRGRVVGIMGIVDIGI